MRYPAYMPQYEQTLQEDVNDTTGGRLTRAREAKGLTTSQLARRVGVKTKTLQNWETDRTAPRSNRLAMLAGVLNVSPTWILIRRGEAPFDAEEGKASEDRQELLDLRRSIQTKVEELKQIVERVDSMLDNRSGL